MSVEMGCAMRMKAMSMVFCALFVIGALGATPSAFALDGRAEVSNAFAYLLSTLADVESVLSENVEISNSILSVEGAKGGFRAAKADYRLSDNAKKSIEEIRQYSVDREENMSRYGDVVRSTEIIPEYMTVVSSDSKDSVFQYSVLYKRDLPQLSEEGDEWVERVEYDVEFGGGGIIENIIARNLNYYLQQEDDFENILPDNALMERLERSTTSVNRSSIVSYATKYAYNYIQLISVMRLSMLIVPILHHRQCMQVDGRKTMNGWGMMWPRLMLGRSLMISTGMGWGAVLRLMQI